MVINFWFDSYAPHPPWSPTRGRLTEMDLFLTSRLHCYYTLCQDQSLQLGLMLRWLPTYSSKFPMKKIMNSSVHPPNHSLHSGFRQSPNTSPPIVPSAAAHWNSLKVRGIREKKSPVGTIRIRMKEKEAKNKLWASRAWHDCRLIQAGSNPDRSSEIRAKMMCWKAGDPWAFLNHQVSLSQHTRHHPRQTGGSFLIGDYTLSTTEGKWSVNSIHYRQGRPKTSGQLKSYF